MSKGQTKKTREAAGNRRKLTRAEKKQIAEAIRKAKGDGKARTAQQTIVLLGCCLAILPYLFGALYLQKSHKQCQLWLAALAILIPSVVEKAAIYLFGAYLYNLRPINVVGVMEAIKSNAPYTNFIKNQSAQNLINLSYFNWTYILCSIAISVLVILLLHKTKQKSNKG